MLIKSRDAIQQTLLTEEIEKHINAELVGSFCANKEWRCNKTNTLLTEEIEQHINAELVGRFCANKA